MLKKIRQAYHRSLAAEALRLDSQGIPNWADHHSEISVRLAKGILNAMELPISEGYLSGQTVGKIFERLTSAYIEQVFRLLKHLRPGDWQFSVGEKIEDFEQYEHLASLSTTLKAHKELRATLGDYLIHPDIVVGRLPVTDDLINAERPLIAPERNTVANLTPMRRANSSKPILHASISCKWTIRSDRSQNVRTEGLNLIRNRKGQTPHIVVVTAEPYPQRIASLAMGTGDIDCVYHAALYELQTAAEHLANEAVSEMLEILVQGKRLRDISDLPLDLTA